MRSWNALSERFFFNDTATTEIYTLSLHDALPISMLLVDGATVVAAVIGVAPVAPVPAPGPQAEPSTTRSTTTTVCLGKYGTTRCFHAFAPGARWATLRNVAGGGSTSRSGGSLYRSWLQPGPHWPPGGGRR